MKKFFKLTAVAGLLVSLSACQKEYEAPKSNVVEMSGQWLVQFYYDADNDGVLSEDDVLYGDYTEVRIVTSNVASNAKDTLLVTDLGFWPFKVKFPINLSDLTFKQVAGLPNLELEEESVRVVEGKILKGAAKNQLGLPADSIFLNLEFTDDEGSNYFYTGYRDNGYDFQ